MIFGKLIGAFLGYLAGGLLGAVVGAIAGHFFDRGLGQITGFDFGTERAAVKQAFFETIFRITGHLAKADGRVSEAEIAQVEALMGQMGLTPEHRREAIALFHEGKSDDFQLEPEIRRFLQSAGRVALMRQMLLEYSITIALADGELHRAEEQVLLTVARYLRVNEQRFRRLLEMLQAQQHFAGSRPGSAPGRDEIADAHRALGVSPDASDAEIKRAYRRLMSKHHPDKLIAKGVPEDMIQVATEKSQEIRAAYELITETRKRAA